MDFTGHGFEHVLKEFPGYLPVGFACEEKELFLGGLHLGNSDVGESHGVALELQPLGFVTFHLWWARDALSLQASVPN